MYLGIDLGTSGVKILLVSEVGEVITSADEALDNPHPHPGWSEQDPHQWIRACEAAIGKIKKQHPTGLAGLKAIGLSGQMHGATLLDRHDKVLRPCILWNDTRSSKQAASLDKIEEMRRISGNIVFPGFTAPKLLWIQQNEPELFDHIAKVLLPKDYLRLWLTGDHVSDMSDSAGTSWLDVEKRQWSSRALEITGMNLSAMPDLCEGSEPGGTLRKDLCQQWGIDGSVIVAGGGGDNAAAACGIGCYEEGSGLLSLGTSGVLLAARSSFSPAPATAVHTFCHALPERYYQMGVMLAAADSLNWLAKSMNRDAAELAGALPDEISGPGRAIFVPYLSGERTPHNDANVRGAFVGLDIAAGSSDLTQAVMEGIAYSMMDSYQALKDTGAKLEHVITLGGGSRSRFWLKTLASTLNLPLHIPQKGELGAALGAARLAMTAYTGDDPAQIMIKPVIDRLIEPDSSLHEAYAAAYVRYRALYPALREEASQHKL